MCTLRFRTIPAKFSLLSSLAKVSPRLLNEDEFSFDDTRQINGTSFHDYFLTYSFINSIARKYKNILEHFSKDGMDYSNNT